MEFFYFIFAGDCLPETQTFYNFSNLFLICTFFLSKAMIILAWNGGSPSDLFDGIVFKKILSVFITAAILKLAQGTS